MTKSASFFVMLLLCVGCQVPVTSLKEFSLARYSDTLVYANNSVIEIQLIGEGFEGDQITDGGALECHTDNSNCCRSTDGMAGGEWYGPDGNVIIAANQIGSDNGLYRTRGHMVIRLNRRGSASGLPTGVYQCEIPGPGGVIITRYINLTSGDDLCADLPSLTNGDNTYTPPRVVSPALPDGQRFQGTIATYSCWSGYQPVGGSTQRACVGGTWNGTQPYCCKQDFQCTFDEITGPENGQAMITGNCNAIYTCDTGYILVGSLSRTCGADGNWTPPEPTCQIIDCSPLTAPANGQVNTSSGTTFGSTAIYTCGTNYSLSGLASRTCEADGMWAPPAPTCEIIDCGPLTAPANGQVDTSSGTTIFSAATYTCSTGYIIAEPSTRTCRADGNWTPIEPSCQIVNCDSLAAPANGQVDTSSGTIFGSTATYTCDIGYTLVGSPSRTCGADGNWTFAEPICQIVSCGPLTAPDNGQVDTTSGTTFGSTATYTCDTGYALVGSIMRCCQADGIWSSVAPICQNKVEYCLLSITSTPTTATTTQAPTTSPTDPPTQATAPDTSTQSTTQQDLTTQSSDTNVINVGSEVSGIVGGVIAVVWFLISILIIANMAIYILYLKKQLKEHSRGQQRSAAQYETVSGGSAPEYEVMEGGGAEYEEIDKVKEKRGQPHPPKGDYELTQCAAYGPVNKDNV